MLIDWNNFMPENILESAICINNIERANIFKFKGMDIAYEGRIRINNVDNTQIGYSNYTKYPTVTYDVEMLPQEKKILANLFDTKSEAKNTLSRKFAIMSMVWNDNKKHFFPCFVETIPSCLTGERTFNTTYHKDKIIIIVFIDDTKHNTIKDISELNKEAFEKNKKTKIANRFDIIDI